MKIDEKNERTTDTTAPVSRLCCKVPGSEPFHCFSDGEWKPEDPC